MRLTPRNAIHTVSVVVRDSPLFPIPFAEPGSLMCLTRATAEWHQFAGEAWRLHVVTVYGAANNGSTVTVDYFPDNPSKKLPVEFDEWVKSTHPERTNEEQTA